MALTMNTFSRSVEKVAANLGTTVKTVHIHVGTNCFVESAKDDVFYMMMPGPDEPILLRFADGRMPGHIYRSYDEERHYVNDNEWYVASGPTTFLKVVQVPVDCVSIVSANQVIFPAGKIR